MVDYFATVAPGLEGAAARELEQLGAQSVQTEKAGVRFAGDRATLYRANLWLRTAFRILVPVAEFPCGDARELYRGARDVTWEDYLDSDATLAVFCTGSNRQLNHTHYSALQVKNAIVDRQRDRTGRRSSVDTQSPDLTVNLHIRGDRGTLSLDSSGPSLHRRGYRPAVGRAPLKETLAAGLLALSDWTPELPFLDPLCGSGTLPLEAAGIALQQAPGLERSFAFESWPDFDPSLWAALRTEARERQRATLPAPIWGRDRDSTVIAEAQFNATQCGLERAVQFECGELSALEAPAERGVLICNPPYGKRLGDVEELTPLYKELGDVFKQRFAGWTAYVFTGSKELSKRVGLRASQRIPLTNGAIPCTLLRYELY